MWKWQRSEQISSGMIGLKWTIWTWQSWMLFGNIILFYRFEIELRNFEPLILENDIKLAMASLLTRCWRSFMGETIWFHIWQRWQNFHVLTQCVLRLTKLIQQASGNETVYNWFSSVKFVDEVAKRKLIYFETQKN